MGKEAKNGFLLLAKHGLNKHEIRPKSGLILRERTIERERREEEEEEEKKKRRRGRSQGMELGFWFGTIWFCMDFLSRYMFMGCGL